MSRNGNWSAAEIAQARKLISAGVTSSKEIATRLRRPHTGHVWLQMRRHCGDLLPDKRVYARRSTPALTIVRKLGEASETPADDTERPQPWHPLHDNARLLSVLAGAL